MIPQERRKHALELLEHAGYLSVGELAKRLFISEPTVRRDLLILEREGAIRRTHGGASFIPNDAYVWPFDLRRRVNLEEKNYIGHLAAQLVKDGDAVFIDSGSTVYCLAKVLDPAIRLTVMTNCIPIAQLLAEQASKTVELPCGFYDAHDACVYGDEVVASISRRWARYFFVSMGAFSAEKGFTGVDQKGISAKLAFHRHAEQTVLLMNSDKLSQPGYYRVFDWCDIDILVTDRPLGEAERECCQKHNIRVICSQQDLTSTQ